MKLSLLVATALATAIVAVNAQTPAPSKVPIPPITAQADPVKLTVSRAHLQVIGQALQELPAKLANPVLNDLQAQLAAADKEASGAAFKAAVDKAAADPPKPDDTATTSPKKKP